MVKNKHMLLIGTIILLVQIVWTPELWSIIELNGHHWWLIRLPLVLSIPVGISLFLLFNRRCQLSWKGVSRRGLIELCEENNVLLMA